MYETLSYVLQKNGVVSFGQYQETDEKLLKKLLNLASVSHESFRSPFYAMLIDLCHGGST
ncbi:hypothetical protein MNBD_ALPHA04-316 [hydrothermal vent metagenome]|uniref:Uncharacterized protein n=1 Tax=hydrothermal vent metagenome TaxID=652676 RepID=A0A3B0R3W3_9ZZZZ